MAARRAAPSPQTSSLSSKIATVGIVTWSTTLADVQSAQIDFGLTTSYGMTAPVDLTQPSYRTLLLGMKSSHMYHYRITATNGSGDCQSPDYTIMTGPLANGLVKPTVTTNNAARAGGRLLDHGPVRRRTRTAARRRYILDSDGDIVWWYNIEDYVTGVVMDYAGTHMWINNHPPNLADAKVHRVSMDGLTDEDLSSQMYELSHQLTVLPDETVAFYAADSGTDGCSDIKERAPNGTVRTIVNSQKALGTTGQCHVNNIQYSSAGRHAGLLRPHSLRGREDQAVRRVGRLDPERGDQDVHRRQLAGERARHPHPGPRRLPHLQQQLADRRGHHHARRWARATARARWRSSWI